MEDEKKKLLKAITACADKASVADTADEALKFSQAALNAAHALTTLALMPKE